MWLLVNPWIYLVLLLDIHSTVCEGVYTLVVQKEELSLNEAIQVCHEKGARLPSGTMVDHALLVEAFKLNNLAKAWVNIKAKRSEYLTWLDGAHVNDRLFDAYDANCGRINVDDETLLEYYCDSLYSSLCQMISDEFTSCPSNLSCFKFHKSYYFVNNDYLNWYEAYNYCTSVGWNIAILKSGEIPSLSRALRKEAGRRLYTSDLWVGSRTVDWLNTGTTERVERYHWLEGQPNVRKDCVVLKTEESQAGWKSVRCSENANFACIFSQDTYDGNEFTIDAEEEPQYITEYDDYTILGEDQTNRETTSVNDSADAVNFISVATTITGVTVCGVIIIIIYLRGKEEKNLKDT